MQGLRSGTPSLRPSIDLLYVIKQVLNPSRVMQTLAQFESLNHHKKTIHMPTYVYEIIPDNPSLEITTFEYKQGMNDEPITVHPETGQPVRRVITGGFTLGSINHNSSSTSSCCSSGSCCN